MNDLFFRIGFSNRAHVIVSPSRRQHPEANDVWDGNWVDAKVTIAAGGFRGSVEAHLRAEDFTRFRDQLGPLREQLAGTPKFDTMEDWLTIEIKGDGKGHFEASCIAVDQPGMGNRLRFSTQFDQAELAELQRGLDSICEEIPVIAKPAS